MRPYARAVVRRRPFGLGPDPGDPFPPAHLALREPDGLLAVGGDLTPRRLLAAYAGGIFPWYSAGQPVLWWSPDPRTVFRTDAVHLSTRFRRDLRRSTWTVTADTAFDEVLAACAHTPRPGETGTWITDEMAAAYSALHRLGHAHSVEVRDPDGALVGGLYGVALGRMVFGESMVSLRTGGSKVALAGLCARLHSWGFPLLDAQVHNDHLARMGAGTMDRDDFLAAVAVLVAAPGTPGSWTPRFGSLPARDLA